MRLTFLIFIIIFPILVYSSTKSKTININDRVNNASTRFAVADLQKQLAKSGYASGGKNAGYTLSVQLDTTLGKQAYLLQTKGNTLTVKGGDAIGAMYGIFDLSEQIGITADLAKIEAKNRHPFIEYRGIKFNIPLDGRLPSYDDTGDAAQNNIAEMWNMDFWHEFLDNLARNRYNMLTFWSQHPFPAMIKLADYPGAEMEDVYVYNKPIPVTIHRNWPDIDLRDLSNFRKVKSMTIDQKIKFWQEVMSYAHDRGIEIMWFTWNIFITPDDPKYNFKPESPEALDYMYKSVKTMVETYPYLSGFGVTAGENMGLKVGKYTNIQWMWEAYGKAIADVKMEHPERPFRFIFRQHNTNLPAIDKDFSQNFPGKVETSYKYSVAHIYSSPKPLHFEHGYLDDVTKYDTQCWMNLRNDDIFCFRWGNPDYVREYLKFMMQYPVPGFYMGSDGYVWGREFTSKNPSLSGELEIKKHWYPFLLWGRLGYDPEISNSYFKSIIGGHFPETDASTLFDAWQTASKVIPLVNNFHWQPGDEQWAVEGCMNNIEGFQNLRDFIDSHTLDTKLILDIPAYVEILKAGETTTLQTPLQVADTLRLYANETCKLLEEIRRQGDKFDDELKATIGDIRCQALYGEYYAGKIAAATYLHMYECMKDAQKASYKEKAKEQILLANEAWTKLAEIADSEYRPQHLARTRMLDWKAMLTDIKQDVEIIAQSNGHEPKIAKLFLPTGDPGISMAAKEKIVNALKNEGYTVMDVRAWERGGHLTGLKFFFYKVEETESLLKRADGGALHKEFEKRGTAYMKRGNENIFFVKDKESSVLAADLLIEMLNAGKFEN